MGAGLWGATHCRPFIRGGGGGRGGERRGGEGGEGRRGEGRVGGERRGGEGRRRGEGRRGRRERLFSIISSSRGMILTSCW